MLTFNNITSGIISLLYTHTHIHFHTLNIDYISTEKNDTLYTIFPDFPAFTKHFPDFAAFITYFPDFSAFTKYFPDFLAFPRGKIFADFTIF